MAKILLESAKVEKTGNGHFTVVEEFTRNDGSVGKTWYKVWSTAAVEVGDLVKVTGIMSAKPAVDFATGKERKWTDRGGVEHTSVEVHVNEAQAAKLSGNDPF